MFPPDNHLSMQRWILLVALALVALLGLAAGCGSDDEDDGSADTAAAAEPGSTVSLSIPGATSDAEPIVVDVTVPPEGTTLGIASPLNADPGQAAMDTANERVATLVGAESVLEDADLDASRQLQIADSMLARGFQVIATDILFPKSLDPFLARAEAKGTPVCVEFSDLPGGANEDWAQAGEEMAAFLDEQFPDGAQGAVLGNTPAPVILNREKGFLDAMKQYPDLRIVDRERNLKEVVAEARTIAENMLEQNPDLQFIWATNDQGAIGAGLAARALNKDVVIIGMNGTPEAVDAVTSGLISATWDSNQNAMGALVAANCFNWLASGTAPEASTVQFTQITAENADAWIPWPDRPTQTVLGDGGAAAAPAADGDEASGDVTIEVLPVLSSQEPQQVTVPRPAEEYQLGFVAPLLTEPGVSSVAAGARKAAEDAGVEIEVTDVGLDANKQVQVADDMLARGYDGIMTIDLFANAMDRFYARADAKGVPNATEYSTRPAGVGEDWRQPGREAVELILEQFPDGATGVMLSDTPAPVIQNREKGFREAVAASGGKVEVVDLKRNLKETLDEARRLADDILRQHPDVDFVWGSNDVQAIGMGLAANAAGEDLLITGMNGSPDGVEAIQQGLIDVTWDANQNAQGQLLVTNMLTWIATGQAPEDQLLPFTRIDSSNVEEYIPWTERAGE